ncbi:MAG: hypothetical protein GY842_19250 [bacterium]|nr:hypothetical protein [bacterium]
MLTAKLQPELRGPLRWQRWALLAVLILASVLRFSGITREGIRFDDEGAYATDARLWHGVASALTDGEVLSAVVHRDKYALQARLDALGVDFHDRYEKPGQGYTFLVAAVMFLVGDQPAALLVTNAICGTLAVLVVYLLGAVLFERSVGLCAAFLLAVSPYHLAYCRSGLTEATAGLFILIGFLIWAYGRKCGWSPRRTFGLSGLALGYAMVCHHRSAYLPLVLVLADLLAVRQSAGASAAYPASGTKYSAFKLQARSVFRRWMWLGLGIAGPALALESVFVAARVSAYLADAHLPLVTYLQACWSWAALDYGTSFGADSGGVVNWQVPYAYVGYFTHWHGAAASVVALLGVLCVLRTEGTAKAPAIVVTATLLLLLFQRHTVARALSAAVPFILICTSVAILQVVRYLTARHGPDRFANHGAGGFAVVLTALVATVGTVHSLQLLGRRSQMVDATTFLAGQGGGTVAVPLDDRKYRVYLEDAGVDVLAEHYRWRGEPEVALTSLRERGVRWMIIDPRHWHYKCTPICEPIFQWWTRMDALLTQETVLAAEFRHLQDSRWEYLAEGPGTEYVELMSESDGGSLKVYDLLAQPVDCRTTIAVARRGRPNEDG